MQEENEFYRDEQKSKNKKYDGKMMIEANANAYERRKKNADLRGIRNLFALES